MRKRNVAYLIDKLFWVLVLILPLICYVVYCFSIPPNVNTTDYMDLEYIANTAKVDFNTGYYASNVSKFDITYQITGNNSGTLFGGEASGIGVQMTGTCNATTRFGPWLIAQTPSGWSSDGDKHHVVWDKDYLYQDDTLVATPSETYSNFTSYNATRIWGRGSTNPSLSVATFKLFDFKIYNNNELVRHYVPVMRANDRQIGLYEKVSGDFTPLFNNVVAGDIISDGNNAGNLPTLDFVMQKMGFTISTDNIVYKTLDGIFGANGVLSFVISQSALIYMTYFVFVELIHLAVDFLVFIPRLCHKWMGDLTNEN